MKKAIFKMILDFYQNNNQSGMTVSWILDTFIKQGDANVSLEEINDALEQLQKEGKIIWMVGGFYKPS
ncbi:hypothetical protein [Neisseria subflava]|uniref:hypothetical protein n=1 Tax=Neisseria subflava TaxID=28449 RepID=UPI0016616FA6|nr:hypothetical protein [Neisseria subflava]